MNFRRYLELINNEYTEIKNSIPIIDNLILAHKEYWRILDVSRDSNDIEYFCRNVYSKKEQWIKDLSIKKTLIRNNK